MKVFKYPVEDHQPPIGAPGATLLVHAGPDPKGDLCIWALVEPNQYPDAVIRVKVYGTGQTIPDDLDIPHLSSHVTGPFVWHVFAAITYDLHDLGLGAA